MESSARKQFDFENNITLVDPTKDGIYAYDDTEQKTLGEKRPWKDNPNYFKRVRISAVALLKMVMHARSGGSIEIMGLMQGKIAHETFIVTDAFPLPVEGTETRVNAQEQAYEYMGAYVDSQKAEKRPENIVGWYHSHPGYGCWLSGIDVNTQMNQQKFTDPFLAVVIDPDRTISAGKVDIGAFRTYPEGHKGKSDEEGEYQTIPLAKIEDFGAHTNQYYTLEVSHFKSSLDTHLLDLLWNKYWVSTLSQSPLFTNRDYSTKQMVDLSQKIHKTEHSLLSGVGKSNRSSLLAPSITGKPQAEGQLDKVVKDSNKIASEEITGLFSSVVKDRVFGGVDVVTSTRKQS
ncbi:JAB1/Mov34/MPN/PAD-1 ubiquitin protease-domain-containing protein [Tuber brumale]|nr:JAB1/Mov34/MPN/PAD-1 ubiquitin protease-domain-containing protein [Tuber brumale]